MAVGKALVTGADMQSVRRYFKVRVRDWARMVGYQANSVWVIEQKAETPVSGEYLNRCRVVVEEIKAGVAIGRLIQKPIFGENGWRRVGRRSEDGRRKATDGVGAPG